MFTLEKPFLFDPRQLQALDDMQLRCLYLNALRGRGVLIRTGMRDNVPYAYIDGFDSKSPETEEAIKVASACVTEMKQRKLISAEDEILWHAHVYIGIGGHKLQTLEGLECYEGMLLITDGLDIIGNRPDRSIFDRIIDTIRVMAPTRGFMFESWRQKFFSPPTTRTA